ncbi:hypothetical protein KDL29_04195 [bacterium]|nr:hypothetical protein [bacterium]
MRYGRQKIAMLLCAVLALASCGSNARPGDAALDATVSPHATLRLDGLELLDGSMLDTVDSRGISVQWSDVDGQPVASIIADGVQDLRALYFSLEHDDSLQAGAFTAGDWAAGNSLSLALTPEAGHSEAGIVLVNPEDGSGFSGSGVLARLEFQPADSGERSSSAAPSTEASRMQLYFAPDFGLLYWYYRNQGDYDQNGEVNISDLTPLAIHFGKAAAGGSFDFTKVESVVDGDGNGEINISDISPIGANFGNSVQDFKLYFGTMADYPANPGDTPGGLEIESWPLADASGEAASKRLYFTKQLPIMVPAASGLWLHPVSGSSIGIASTSVGFGNQSPQVSLQAAPLTGVAPFSVSADGSASSDPDGDPLSYTWVFGDLTALYTSDALYNPADMGAQFSVDVETGGEYVLILMVRDPQGAVAFQVQDVVAVDNAGWQIREFDMTGNHPTLETIFDVDVCEVAGRPTIAYAYKQGTTGGHVYLLQGDSLFDGDWDIDNLVYGQSGTNFCEVAVAEIDGTAAVAASYDRGGNGEAVFARQVESGGTDMYNTLVFEQSTGALSGVDLANINGQAMVAYRNNASGELRFCVAIDSSAQNFVGPFNVGITGAPSSQICLAEVQGAPAFSYWAGPSSNRLRYHTAVMNGPLPVFNSGTTLAVLTSCYLSDALIVREDGSPSVLFDIPVNTAIYGLRAADPQASMWTADGEISQAGAAIGEYCAGMHGGRPAILWYDFLTAELYYQRAADADGTSWEAAVLVDDSLALGTRPCMAEVLGVPVIAYIDKGRNMICYGIYVE